MPVRFLRSPYIQNDGTSVVDCVVDLHSEIPSNMAIGSRAFCKEHNVDHAKGNTTWLDGAGATTTPGPGGAHPDLEAHDVLGLATQLEVDGVAGNVANLQTLQSTQAHISMGLASTQYVDSTFSPIHTHPYSATAHNHDAAYSLLAHTHAGGGGIEYNYRAVVRRDGATYTARDFDGNVLSQGSNGRTVAQAALNFVGTNGGGSAFFMAGVYENPDSTSFIVPSNVVVRGEGSTMAAGTNGAPTGGTIFRSMNASTTYVVDMLDAPGGQFRDATIDANNNATNCIRMGGWQQRIQDYHVTGAKNGGNLIYVQGGNDATGFGYADMHIGAGLWTGLGRTVKGLFVDVGPGTNKPTDGDVDDIRAFGCQTAIMDIDAGGWEVRAKHITGNSTCAAGIQMSGGSIQGTQIDSIGSGPAIDATGDRLTVRGVWIQMANMAANNTHSAIRLAGGSQGVIIDGVRLSNTTATTVRWLVDTGASPLNRAIYIEGLEASWTSVGANPLGTGFIGNASTNYTTAALAGYVFPRAAQTVALT